MQATTVDGSMPQPQMMAQVMQMGIGMMPQVSTGQPISSPVDPNAHMQPSAAEAQAVGAQVLADSARRFESSLSAAASDGIMTTASEAAPPYQSVNTAQSVRGEVVGHAPRSDPLQFTNLLEFVSKPAPEGVVVKCSIKRDKGSMIGKKSHPIYILSLETEIDGVAQPDRFLLAARKRMKSKSSNYLISIDQNDLARDGDGYVAKLRASSIFGGAFTVYGDGINPKDVNKAKGAGAKVRCELAAVLFETNILGFGGPRKMTVVIPGMMESGVPGETKPFEVKPMTERDTILERIKRGRNTDLITMSNKKPQWNEVSQSYTLNFQGRVTKASVKNFQIVHDEDQDYVVLQFGRVEDSLFTMDYQYPMTAIQAFAICLSSFDNKLACE